LAKPITWTRCGREHILIALGDRPGDTAFTAAFALRRSIESGAFEAVRDYVIGPCTALVQFHRRPDVDVESCASALVQAVRAAAEARQPRRHRKRVPLVYDGRDLQRAADLAGMSTDQFIRRHSEGTYRVYAMGGSPGFAFLDGLDERLRLDPPARPGPKVKAGAVAIAGPECFVVGSDQAGAWHVIARTVEPVFDAGRRPPFLLSPCDLVRFKTAAETPSDKAPEAGT
jgi:KipI family sensor histidine kinase inhibitor